MRFCRRILSHRGPHCNHLYPFSWGTWQANANLTLTRESIVSRPLKKCGTGF